MFDSKAVNPADIVRVDIEDNDVLQAAYMPFITNGAMFVHMAQLGNMSYSLGTDVYLLLHFKEQNKRLPVHSRTVWVAGKGSNRHAAGIGVQFRDAGETHKQLEQILDARLDSTAPTFTL